MIQPEQVRTEAKKKEDENFKFRSCLKGYADEEEYGMNYQTRHRPCDFLQEDGNCKLGDCKPDSCKKYPYTDQPERLSSLLSILDTIEICSVAFEIFERLKEEYRFRVRRLRKEEIIVKGIYSSWREILVNHPIPQIVEATLIPFRDTIIHDGIVAPYGMCLGKNMSEQSKQIYLAAKTSGNLHYSL